MLSFIFSEEIYITAYSQSFTIDSIVPEIELFEPGAGDSYEHGDIINVSWNSSDQSPLNNPITINVSPYLDDDYIELHTNLPNNGSFDLFAPQFINSFFVSIRIDVKDSYGNISYAYNEGYFTIGEPQDNEIITTNFYQEYTSNTFTIDTKKPEVTWVSPNDQDAYEAGDVVAVSWDASDETLNQDDSVDIYFQIDNGLSEYLLAESLQNSGQTTIIIPDINSQFVLFEARATDNYGNIGKDVSNNYIVIGEQENPELEINTSLDSTYTSLFTIDTKAPEFVPLSNGNYFYPNGSEIFEDYTNIPIDFSATDDSDEAASVDVSLGYILGGWYLPVAENISFESDCSNSNCTIDMSVNGLVESSIWGRLIFKATDDFGNTTEQYNDDYFVLGSTEGDIALNWFDEDEGEILLDWGWNGATHTVGMKRNAIAQYLQSGDQITYVDLNGIPTSSCNDDNGYVELYNFTITDSSYSSKETLLKGINHCEQGGEKRPGYVQGNPVYLKITPSNGDAPYLVLPDSSTVEGSNRFNDTHTIIRNINFSNTIPLNYSYNSIMSSDDRDYDGFSIYNKITSIRDCDIPGTGENSGWCFEETVYNQNTYVDRIPNMQQSSNVKYRVWLLDNAGNEVFKTLDTGGLNYYVELSDIYDKSLAFGWNWFSTNMSANDMSINTMLSSLSDAGSYIKSQSQYADYYNGVGWLGTLASLDNLSMYKINLTGSSGNISYEGVQLTPSQTPLSLNSGWNWISYIPNESININDALASISNNATYIKSQSGYADYYDGIGWLGTISELDPKDGYMINASNATTLTYPDTRTSMQKTHKIEKPDYYWDFNYRDYQNNGSITLELDDIDIQIEENDQIAAFYNDECRGLGYAEKSQLTDEYVFQIMLYGDESDILLNFKLYDDSEDSIYDLNEKISYYPNIHSNTLLDPFRMSTINNKNLKLDNPYPNPFNPTTSISYNIPFETNNLSINVYDITGRLVEELYKGNQFKGKHKITWNAEKFSSGVYFIKLQTSNEQITKKIILIK